MDQAQQIAESDAFQAQQQAEEANRNQQGCTACTARWQGCMGARRPRTDCDSEFRSCAFQEVGADWIGNCPNPM